MSSPLPLKKKKKKVFTKGDKVETCSQDDGFQGSYFEAEIISNLIKNKTGNLYVVQYKNLLEDDESGPLIGTVYEKEVRPLPPKITNTCDGFALYEKVDAFDKDGWWEGIISGKIADSDYYYVYFDYFVEETAYPISSLRVHQDWVGGKWV
ncbi:Agenet-like domain-containing protein [Quillaja saponaria]|uniref:Agenet-like domain-containing protein n=1 Tax=Quillaja saponaria TaxID=32244 RepID=A0AAD7KZ45_QUISA|nr:Agenet-like domain-containing protein [Quillaja saponaria]